MAVRLSLNCLQSSWRAESKAERKAAAPGHIPGTTHEHILPQLCAEVTSAAANTSPTAARPSFLL